MHHTQDQDHTGVNPRTFLPKPNIVECVNVLFHDSVPGLLLSCNANKQAIAQIQATLQQYKWSANGKQGELGEMLEPVSEESRVGYVGQV